MNAINFYNGVLDLSHWQDKVNFEVLTQNGMSAIIHKATQGIRYVDPKYHYAGCFAGLPLNIAYLSLPVFVW